MTLVKSNDRLPSDISNRSFKVNMEELGSYLVYSSLEEIKEDIPFLPFVLSMNGVEFRKIYASLKNSIPKLQERLERLNSYSVEEFIGMAQEFHTDLLKHLQSTVGNEYGTRFFIDAKADLIADNVHVVTDYSKSYAFGSGGTYIEEYNVKANSYHHDKNNPITSGIQFLAPQILLESSVHFKKDSIITAETLYPAILEQKKKSTKALLVVLEGILPAYESIVSGEFEDIIVNMA